MSSCMPFLPAPAVHLRFELGLYWATGTLKEWSVQKTQKHGQTSNNITLSAAEGQHTQGRAPRRLAGSGRSRRLMRSAAAASMPGGMRSLPEAMRSNVRYSEAARKGALPTSIWYTMQPSAHRSASGPTGSFRSVCTAPAARLGRSRRGANSVCVERAHAQPSHCNTGRGRLRLILMVTKLPYWLCRISSSQDKVSHVTCHND